MNLELALTRAGISYRQFDYWNTRGFLPWGNPGSGNPRPTNISERRADILIAMGHLVRDGMAPARASVVATELVDKGSATIGGCTLIRSAA